jgi:hypothetical protein
MKLFKKVFLFTVGVVTMAFDEVSKSIHELTESMEEQRKKVEGRMQHQ